VSEVMHPGDVTTALAWTLVTSCWAAALLGALAWSVLAYGTRFGPTTRYATSLALFASLIVVPIATLTNGLGDVREPTPPAGAHAPMSPGAEPQASVTSAVAALNPDGTGLTAGAARALVPTGFFNRVLDRWVSLQETLLAGIAPVSHLLVLAWLLGVAAFAARLLLDLRVIRTLKRSPLLPLPSAHAGRAVVLRRRAGLSDSVRVAASSFVAVPLVLGVFKPVVILPTRIVTSLPEEDVEMLVAHELAHVERFDYAVNLAQVAVECLLFFHPVTWWLSRRVRTEREHCCDERALELIDSAQPVSRHRYVAALLAAEEARPGQTPRLAPGSSRQSLLHRAKELLQPNPRRRPNALGYALASAFVVTLFGLIALPQPSVAAVRAKPEFRVDARPTVNPPVMTVASQQDQEIWRGVVETGGWLRLRNLVGDVIVERAGGSEVIVWAAGRRRSSPTSFRATRDRNGVTICALRPGVSCDENGNVVRVAMRELLTDSATLTVSLPEGVNVLAASSDGALHLTGGLASVHAQTGKGTISVSGARGPVEAATGAGAVRVDNANVGVVVRSGGGSVTLQEIGGDVEVRSSNGDIHVSTAASPAAHTWSFQTSSGSIVLQGALLARAQIAADAPNGRIRSDFPYVKTPNGSHIRAARSSSGDGFIFASAPNGNVTMQTGR
jgi:beta-lactamase regulating signal transducer with metallopeptidase domain